MLIDKLNELVMMSFSILNDPSTSSNLSTWVWNKNHSSSDQNPGYLLILPSYIGIYNKPIWGSLWTNHYNGLSMSGFNIAVTHLDYHLKLKSNKNHSEAPFKQTDKTTSGLKPWQVLNTWKVKNRSFCWVYGVPCRAWQHIFTLLLAVYCHYIPGISCLGMREFAPHLLLWTKSLQVSAGSGEEARDQK